MGAVVATGGSVGEDREEGKDLRSGKWWLREFGMGLGWQSAPRAIAVLTSGGSRKVRTPEGNVPRENGGRSASRPAGRKVPQKIYRPGRDEESKRQRRQDIQPGVRVKWWGKSPPLQG